MPPALLLDLPLPARLLLLLSLPLLLLSPRLALRVLLWLALRLTLLLPRRRLLRPLLRARLALSWAAALARVTRLREGGGGR
ncbi:MAG: hypothetical protein NZM07_08820 [Elioraea sp.]|nr:hypothetical protein [Elioraea sp.]